MRLASVILDINTQALDKAYTYLVPEQSSELDERVQIGSCVVVPFGGRKAVGFVIDLRSDAQELESSSGTTVKLKAIERVISKPYFSALGAACAQFLASRYIAPLSACVRLFTPPGGVARMVRDRGGFWRLEKPSIGEVDDRWVVPGPAFEEFRCRKNAVKQGAIVDALRDGELRVAELNAQFGNVTASLKGLEQKGVVRIEHRRRFRGDNLASHEGLRQNDLKASDGLDQESDGLSQKSKRLEQVITSDAVPMTPFRSQFSALVLTDGQAKALELIDRARKAACGQVVLVDGVTGSGKTEVYLRAIETTLNEGRNAIVLVPEISLTPQTVARFRGRFGDTVAVLHSRMGSGERYDQWDFIRSGAARVVVGARSALFAPLDNVGLIVIDEEHESSYKQESAPRYLSRDVAEWMVKQTSGVLVLGSATPSIEALYAASHDPDWHHAHLDERANRKSLPEIKVVDMAAEFRKGSRAMFSRELTEALRRELSQGRKAVLLLNQRGFAKFLLCRDCGFVPSCPSCSTALTYHEKDRRLVCHHCGHQEAVPRLCPECGSPYLKMFGAGTERVEHELRSLLDGLDGVGPSVPIIRMDRDTTATKGAHERLLEAFGKADAAVLLGTQMIAKGLDFDDVTLVGVINADTQLNLPDYRSAERTFDLIEQVAGRAGRAELPGEVYIQTYEPDNPAIKAAAHYDRQAFLDSELPKRRLLGYPPFVRMANILIWGKDSKETEAAARDLYLRIKDLLTGSTETETWELLSPTPCVLERLRGAYRWHILVKSPLNAEPSSVLEPFFRSRPADERVSMAVDVDPVDLL